MWAIKVIPKSFPDKIAVRQSILYRKLLVVQRVKGESGKSLSSKFGLLLKQTIHQQKALDLSFNMAP